MSFGIKCDGNFSKTQAYLKRVKNASEIKIAERYAAKGVAALSSATPVESGKTASSWYYDIERKTGSIKINFYNSSQNDGVNIALILQYGHGTGTGGWVEGRDYINPAIQPIFDELADAAWREVTKL